MGIANLLANLKEVFPSPITNEFINSMSRVTLTAEQSKRDYSKYYFKDMAVIPQKDLDIVNAGALTKEKLLPINQAYKMLEAGYLETETGYGMFDDGTAMAATKVFMPGVTTEMIDWWFNWHPLEGLRYMIWCPVGHTNISAKTPDAHLDNSGTPLHTRNIGKIHYPIEGFNVSGATKVEIAFYPSTVLGITEEDIAKSPITTYEIATCKSVFPPMDINVFFHSVREVEGGIEFRSRYWMKHTVKNGKAQRANTPLPRNQILKAARNNCIHSLTEYNNLASILPQIYAEQQGKIDPVK